MVQGELWNKPGTALVAEVGIELEYGGGCKNVM